MALLDTPTVTVGIPAYNEAGGILNLLASILSQDQVGYTLEKVLVISDGSTDKTVKKVDSLTGKHSLVEVVAGRKRKGKAARLNELYEKNSSDILVTVDADTILADNYVIDRLVSPIKSDNAEVVGGEYRLLPARNLFERVVIAAERVWREIRAPLEGKTIHNSRAVLYALSRQASKKISYPEELVADAHYLYHSCKSLGLSFGYVPQASVFLRGTDNLQDYLSQVKRFTSWEVKKQAAEHFYRLDPATCKIPLRLKVVGVLKALRRDPVFTLPAIFLSVAAKHIAKSRPATISEGVWEPITSTKSNYEYI